MSFQSPASGSLVFDLPAARPNIIKVIGVGGAGGNAVNHMFQTGIHEVDFLLCNTDYQALERSKVNIRLQLGPNLTAGRGAGNRPEVGREAAIETLDDLRAHLGADTRMVFITAGLGGGTGTGAAPVIARLCHELDILTVGIVTLPFSFEGKKRLNQAAEGLEQLREHCDTTLVISNDKVREVYGNLAFDQAFARADDVLATAAKGIAEIITIQGHVNVDFSDVNTVLRKSGKAVMGSGLARGEDRAIGAIKEALSSPLLSDNDITGACSILLNISSGEQTITLDEIGDINDYIQSAAGSDTNIIWGNCTDPQLGDAVRVTVIATGFVGGPIEATRRTLDAPAENAELAQHRGAAGEAPKASHEHQQPELASGARLELREGKQILVHTLDPQGPQSSQNTSSPRQTPVQTVDQAHSQGQAQAAPDGQQPKVDLSPKMSSPEAVQKATHQSAEANATPTNAGANATPPNAEANATPPNAEANATPPMGEPKTLREHLFGDRSPSKALMDFFGSNAKKDDASNETESRPSVQQTSTSPISMSSPPPMAQAAHEDVLGRSERRRQTLRGLSFRGHDASGPGEVRHEPAFMRKGVQLTAVEPSDAQPISRFTLSESPDQRPEIRENNAFLHNNVD
ncbi:MAG: cell division protein FtsZ [Bacteroidia bacterium]